MASVALVVVAFVVAFVVVAASRSFATPAPTLPKRPARQPHAVDGGPAAVPAGPRMLDIAALRREMGSAKGKPLLVHLWASWCGPCLEELPLVESFATEARARGVVVLSFSLDDPKRGARVAEVLRARAPGLTSIVARFDDPDQFMALFSREWEGSIPALFAFDRQGHLLRSLVGSVEPAELKQLLAELLAPSLPAPARDTHRRP